MAEIQKSTKNEKIGKRTKILWKTEKRSVPETATWHFWVTENRKTWKYLRKPASCRNQKAVLKSCGKRENTQKTMKSGGNPENRKKKLPKNIKFFTECRKRTPYNPPHIAKVMISRLTKHLDKINFINQNPGCWIRRNKFFMNSAEYHVDGTVKERERWNLLFFLGIALINTWRYWEV